MCRYDKRKGGKLKLLNLTKKIQDLLSITKLLTVFETYESEDEVKANADYMAKNLKKHGWQYIVVDIQWSEPNAKEHGYRPCACASRIAFVRT